ncbi:MAG: DUF805 domain-containing protein [Bacteroidetes bacterium]|nr:DUF805 domain-containing protein [Bacteroidota bacterium]
MNWYLQVLKKYADFSGRSRRKEYWMFALFNIIFSVITTILDYVLGTDSSIVNAGLFSIIYGLAIFIPSISVAVRRLHDIGKSGWMLLIAIIPIIGAIWLLVLFVSDSATDENQYGPNPKETV